jgi:hypothetical protein
MGAEGNVPQGGGSTWLAKVCGRLGNGIMKSYFPLLAAICLLAAGCASTPSHSAASSDANSNPSASSDAGNSATAQNIGDNSGFPQIPEGAMYTLRCGVYTDALHVQEAKEVKDMLIRQTGSKEWYVVHSADESDIYYGFYKTFEDHTQVAEYARAQSDHAKVASLVDQDGNPIFPLVSFCLINVPDPPAPKEWELSNDHGYWTLQIAVYKGSPQRKQMAVDAVRDFRAHGVEAYYRHGDNTSEVYIGGWPRDAVQEQDASQAQSDDPNQPLLVVPGPLPKGVDGDKVYDQNGRKMKVVMPKLEIVDQTLKQATIQYPYYYVNGEVAGRKVGNPDGSTQVVPWPSYLIQVPHENEDQDQQAKTDTESNPDNDSSNSVPIVPGLGGLK